MRGISSLKKSEGIIHELRVRWKIDGRKLLLVGCNLEVPCHL